MSPSPCVVKHTRLHRGPRVGSSFRVVSPVNVDARQVGAVTTSSSSLLFEKNMGWHRGLCAGSCSLVVSKTVVVRFSLSSPISASAPGSSNDSCRASFADDAAALGTRGIFSQRLTRELRDVELALGTLFVPGAAAVVDHAVPRRKKLPVDGFRVGAFLVDVASVGFTLGLGMPQKTGASVTSVGETWMRELRYR